jgi:mRNA-degrading endonuclease RelE of RelBE toxin-antitoxin system
MPIEITERFVRQYRKLPRTIQQKVDKALALLDADFRHPGLHSHPLESAPGIFEAYVDRKYRMTFERRSDTFILRNVDNHDECLRNP